eukprot:TRINITY_DN55460_c0_g1_i1.p1 TRINITY_DN55460_c0_g1~~TRINITY_DN55460_c0_g1_i1.p1  ORF type:complete len:396 (+),score=80.18 TRINITY_DN55460_c0_g1_i1:70-1188(+)
MPIRGPLGAVAAAVLCGAAAAPRSLLLVTCETSESQWREQAPQRAVHSSVREPVNVCKGVQWKGFATKLSAVRSFALKAAARGPRDVVVFFDARDVLLNPLPSTEVLARYDKLRGSASLVLSTETACYLSGFKGCTQEQHDLLSNGTGMTSAPEGVATRYVNTGVYIGAAAAVARFLGAILQTMLGKRNSKPTLGCDPANDQCQIVDRVLRRPDGIVLDYRQELLAGTGLRLPRAAVRVRGNEELRDTALRKLCWQQRWQWTCYNAVLSCCFTPRVDPAAVFDTSDPCRVARPRRALRSSRSWGGFWGEIPSLELGAAGLAAGRANAPLAWHAPGLPSGAWRLWMPLLKLVGGARCRRQSAARRSAAGRRRS